MTVYIAEKLDMCSGFSMRMKLVGRSVSVSIAPLPFLPAIVSISQSSKRLLFASSGLS